MFIRQLSWVAHAFRLTYYVRYSGRSVGRCVLSRNHRLQKVLYYRKYCTWGLAQASHEDLFFTQDGEGNMKKAHFLASQRHVNSCPATKQQKTPSGLVVSPLFFRDCRDKSLSPLTKTKLKRYGRPLASKRLITLRHTTGFIDQKKKSPRSFQSRILSLGSNRNGGRWAERAKKGDVHGGRNKEVAPCWLLLYLTRHFESPANTAYIHGKRKGKGKG